MTVESSELKARYARLKLLYQVSNVIHSTLEPQEALLLIVRDWAQAHGRPVVALTVDHGLNPDSAVWTQVCAETAGRLGVEVRTNAPVTKIVAVILKHAVEGNASDVHIEHTGDIYKRCLREDLRRRVIVGHCGRGLVEEKFVEASSAERDDPLRDFVEHDIDGTSHPIRRKPRALDG